MNSLGTMRAFVASQIILLACVGGAVGYRLVTFDDSGKLPELRSEPLMIESTINHSKYFDVISDEQLANVLRRLRPKNAGADTQINFVDHALRFWTAEADFGDTNYLSGDQMRALLTDQQVFTSLYGDDADDLLTENSTGVGFVVGAGKTKNSHIDHSLACLAEVGTPLDFPVYTRQRETTYRAMLEHAMRSFSLNQMEYEWTALAFALFVKSDGPETSWRTTEGQRLTFSLLAKRIMRERQPEGVCFGNHRLHGLCVLLLVDKRNPIFHEDTRQEIKDYLVRMSALLVQHQHPDGFWNSDWPTTTPNKEPTSRPGDSKGDRILATGHALEWWAYAPAEAIPPRDDVLRAIRWLSEALEGLSESEIDAMYPFLTHAGRALALWNGKKPHDLKLD